MITNNNNMSQSILTCSSNNPNCADCNTANPTWYDFHQGVFVCTQCSGVHRGLPSKGVRVKSVDLDNWTQEEVREVENKEDNKSVNERLEKFLPAYYPKQGERTPQDIRKEFITHKYVKETFCTHGAFLKYVPGTGRMEGVLEKKGKDKSVWKPRHFVLTPLSIEYFIEDGHSEPKCRLPLSQLELHLEACERTRSCLVLTHLSDTGSSGRKYYVRAAGVDLLFDWYFALLTAQAAKSTFLSPPPVTGSKLGTLYKVGVHSFDLWKPRWFSLQGTRVTYSTDKLSAVTQGDFVLYPADRVEAGVTHKIPPPTKFTFQVVTLTRTYKLCAETAREREEWMDAIGRAISSYNVIAFQ